MAYKIAIDTSSCAYTPMSGTGVYVRNVIPEMMAQGADIEFHLISSKPCDLSWANGAVVHFGEGELSRHNIAWWAIKGNRLLTRINPDVFWSPFQFFPINMSGKWQSMLTIHDLVWHHMPSVMEWKNYWLNRILMKRSFKKSDKIVVVSEATKNDLLDKYDIDANKVFTIHHGSQLGHGSASDDELKSVAARYPFLAKPFILSVGALEPRKNHLRLLQAVEALRMKGYGDYNLIMAGSSGWKNAEFYEYYNKAHAGQWAYIVKDVSMTDLRALYNHAELLVFPSLMEGFGMPIVEAMHCGCPVVTSNISSMPEVAGGAAVLVDPFDIDSISSGIEEALEKKDSLKKMSIERAKNFSWKKSAARHLEVLLS